MFELAKQTPPADAVTIAAQPGCIVLFFAPKPDIKPAMLTLNEIVAANTFPVLAWRLRGNRVEPITIVEPPADAKSYLFAGTKIYALDGSEASWVDRDQWSHAVLAKWQADRHVKKPIVPSGPVTVKPGDTVAVFRH